MCNFWIIFNTFPLVCQLPCWLRGSISLSKNPGPPANVPPCQRQRGFKTGGFGRLYHLQAIFQPIHLSRIIECLCLSTPEGVTSYHKPPAPLLIKRDGRIRLRRIVKKKKKGKGERRMEGQAGPVLFFTLRGEVADSRSSDTGAWQVFSFNI